MVKYCFVACLDKIEILAISISHLVRVGTILARPQHYGLWKDPYPLTVEEVGSNRA